MKYIVGFSGGIDSTFASYKLKQDGNEVLLVNFLTDGKINQEKIDHLNLISQKLGCELIIVDMFAQFQSKIMQNFVEYYKQGKTPNPCVWCNPLIKFEILEQTRKQRGFDTIITGHYAKIWTKNNKKYLAVSDDLYKDQSYVLYKISQTKDSFRLLDNIEFMLGAYQKSDVKKMLEEKGLLLEGNKKESQDICFIPHNDYSTFVLQNSENVYPQGDILDLGGKVLGKHKGIIYYTIGQRYGLGINQKSYVLDIDATQNTLIVGQESDLYKDFLNFKDGFVHEELFEDDDLQNGKIIGKIRYHHGGEKIKSIQKEGLKYQIIFENPVRAITRGQHLVLYKEIDGQKIVVGGGEID